MTMIAAINGMGRVGRATMKILLDNPDIDVAAVNDLIPVEGLAYLLNYDTVYGRYERAVEAVDGDLNVDGVQYAYFSERDPASLPWGDLGIDVVFECTGVFRKKEDLVKHIRAGAGNVILSAPSKSPDVGNVVHGVNARGEGENIISCASCTTNCITPVVEIISRRLGLEKATMTTLHAYTAGQEIVDSYSEDARRGRAGAANLVPTSTGAAKATTGVLPEHEGRFDGVAVRAPVPVVSIADIVCLTGKETNVEEVNGIFEEEAASERYAGILGCTLDPVVSSDIIKDPRASIVDLGMTQVVDGNLLKVMSWYDNEWGYSYQMVREALAMGA
jgi:glyceraldehyde 3-phosphate dehydrogenase